MSFFNRREKLILAVACFVSIIMLMLNNRCLAEYALESDPAVVLKIYNDKFAFVGRGSEYDFLTEYLGCKEGPWNQSEFEKVMKEESGSRHYSNGCFEVSLDEENTLVITTKPYISNCFRFVRSK